MLLSGLYAPKAKNGQKSFIRLVNTQGQGSSDKDCLNVLRSEDLREKGGLSKKSSNKRAEIPQQETKVWQGKERAKDAAGVDI